MSAPKKHAKYSASASHRWMHCPGSVELSEKAPKPKESEYAKEGTDAHTCVEMLLKNRGKELSTAEVLRKKFGQQMVVHAEATVREIHKRVPPGAELRSETKVDLKHLDSEMYGTADAVIIEDFGRLTVIDFKYGAGIPVDAENNSQMAFYALGVAHAHDYNFSEVAMVILQPRAPHEKGWIREWVVPMDELIMWGKKFQDAAAKAKDPLAGFCAGDWCRFCPAAVICPEISGRALQQAQIEFAPESGQLELSQPTSLDPESLSHALTAFEKIELWITQVKAFAHQRLERGEPIPGWKLVPKRGTRKWLDADRAEYEAKRKFGPKAFESSLLSPAQLEKVIDPKWVEERCQIVSSGLTLVPENDPRQAVDQVKKDFTTVAAINECFICGERYPNGEPHACNLTTEKGDDMATKKLTAKKSPDKKKLIKKKTKK